MIFHVVHDQYQTLLPLFPDLPENVHTRYFLIKKLCEVYIIGNILNPKAIVIRPEFDSSELFGYKDPKAICEIIQSIEEWNSILVNNNVSKELGNFLSKTKNIKYEKEIYFTLKQPIINLPTNNTQLLTSNDLPLLKNIHSQLQNAGVTSSYQEMLSNGMIAGTVIHNQLVSIAYATHVTEKYADVGIFTIPEYRNKGYSILVTTFLIQKLQAKNLIPVWSTDENNSASLKVAQKLGFTEIYTKTYINFEK